MLKHNSDGKESV